jgi:DNA-binding transcriptional ArsR family regulator
MDTRVEQYELNHPAEDAVELTAVLSALAEPARLTIVRTVADQGSEGSEAGVACSDVWEKSGLTATKSTMSHHYKVLREAGLVVMWWVGAKKHVRLRRELVDVRWPGLLSAILADPNAPRAASAEKTQAAR